MIAAVAPFAARLGDTQLQNPWTRVSHTRSQACRFAGVLVQRVQVMGAHASRQRYPTRKRV
ncbi:protein of unknown function [Pararobbsia alpina]